MSVYIRVKICMLYGNSSFSCMETFTRKGLSCQVKDEVH